MVDRDACETNAPARPAAAHTPIPVSSMAQAAPPPATDPTRMEREDSAADGAGAQASAAAAAAALVALPQTTPTAARDSGQSPKLQHVMFTLVHHKRGLILIAKGCVTAVISCPGQHVAATRPGARRNTPESALLQVSSAHRPLRQQRQVAEHQTQSAVPSRLHDAGTYNCCSCCCCSCLCCSCSAHTAQAARAVRPW